MTTWQITTKFLQIIRDSEHILNFLIIFSKRDLSVTETVKKKRFKIYIYTFIWQFYLFK